MDNLSESYVKMALAVGQHDPDYVDSYFGPPEWQAAAKAANIPLAVIRNTASALLPVLSAIDLTGAEEIVHLRRENLISKLQALITHVDRLSGKRFSFQDEALGLYGVIPPEYPASFFKQILEKLEIFLPGQGLLEERYDLFRRAFIIPPDKLDLVFQAAIRECRLRTQSRLDLPAHESFVLEYVQNKSWSGYNWYQGNSRSLIQINTDLPIYIDRAVDLAAHEGYPGHHVFHSMMEAHLVKQRKWVEFTIYALFTSQSLVSEGAANFGIELLFPGQERADFERQILFPLAGIDASRVEDYDAVQSLVQKLTYAHNEAARHYLDGRFTAQQAEEWLVQFALLSPERAQQRIRFIDTYRSYVINYNLGQDLVRTYIESRGGSETHPDRRWAVFKRLLSYPITLKN